ncbi:MAG: polysaccharide deacetylase family protein [Lachnospiraceae bacterium]|nr:polysaccharide deacetylase family protein [Lachnospiraceae bacterium]
MRKRMKTNPFTPAAMAPLPTLVLSAFVLTVLLLSASPRSVLAEETTTAEGYASAADGSSCYYVNGQPYTGPRTISGSQYYFINGIMQTQYWYTDESGNQYYFSTDGTMAVGMTEINGSTYYFKANGTMVTGMKKISGDYYYFRENGKMKTGWLTTDNGNRYYFDKKTGIRVTGKKTIGNYIRYFNKKGVLYRSVNKKKKMVALTYDDGPIANTATILNTLKKYNSVATFFVVGNRVSTYSSTVKKAYNMGCEIGNHTYNHTILTTVSASFIKKQISSTNAAVKAVTGVRPVVMRPPGGGYNSTVQSAVKMPLINWSIDTRDWETHSASSTISAVLNHVQDGDIILMHDLYSWTSTASKTIIPTLVKRGYQLVTVSELAECRGGMKKGKVYTSFRK